MKNNLYRPEQFEIEPATFKYCSVNSSQNVLITIEYENNGFCHDYSCGTSEDMQKYLPELLENFNVDNIEKLIKKRLYAVSYNGCFFAIINPENYKTFCMAIKLNMDDYLELAKNLAEEDKSIDIAHLSKEEGIIHAFLYSIPTYIEIEQSIHQHSKNIMQYHKLNQQLHTKKEQSIHKIKI